MTRHDRGGAPPPGPPPPPPPPPGHPRPGRGGPAAPATPRPRLPARGPSAAYAASGRAVPFHLLLASNLTTERARSFMRTPRITPRRAAGLTTALLAAALGGLMP